MLIGIARELVIGENRVALVPLTIKKLNALKIEVLVERGAGEKAGFCDENYLKAGAELCDSATELADRCDLVARINLLATPDDLQLLRPGMTYVGLSSPLVQRSSLESLAALKVTGFGLEKLPRSSRAQSMDVLSSQANLAGYKAVLMGVNELNRVVPMFITAAGTVQPAKVLVMGAGVAGLQAIATAKRLGAVVYGFDVRSAVREQIESLGAKFVEIKLETQAEGQGGYAKELGADTASLLQKKLGEFAAGMDLIVSTAQIPGKKAPILLTNEALKSMKKGAIIIDLAAPTGGNTEATRIDERVQIGGVTILGPSNVPSLLAADASQLFSNNLFSFISLLIKDGAWHVDFSDDIINAACFCHNGELRI